MNINLTNLPKKFHESLLGHDSCTARTARTTIFPEIQRIFQEADSLRPLKSDYILESDQWIIKGKRTDGLLTTDDTHLYRVRKAKKIRKYIQANGCDADIRVPQKFLYWHEERRKFYTICEKIPLSNEVATMTDEWDGLIRATPDETIKSLGGQVEAYVDNAPRREITPRQAKILSELSFLGYTDLSYNNLFFTPQGQIAILDTEPQKRALKKATSFSASKIIWFLINKGALHTQQSLAGTAKLKLYCPNLEARKEIEKIEKKHVVFQVAKQITKIAVLTFAIIYAPSAIALLGTGALLTTALKIGVITPIVLKTIITPIQALGVLKLWSLSHKGFAGILEINQLESNGII